MTSDLLNMEELNDQRDTNDMELRDLVYQALERDGLITHLKAQLRAAVFKTIDKASKPTIDTSSSPTYDTEQGRIVRGLILDWLEHRHLLYTKDLFQVETPVGKALDRENLMKELHLSSDDSNSLPLIEVLVRKSHDQPKAVTTLPEHIKESIESKFHTEKINDLASVREHFRSLFSTAFDSNVLDSYMSKMLPISSTSISKYQYEQICLKWLQSCSQILLTSSKRITPTILPSTITKKTNSIVKPARRDLSAESDSSSDSSSSSSSSSKQNNQDKTNFLSPATSTPKSKPIEHKLPEVTPPQLTNFNKNFHDDEDEEDTSSSIFSRRNATPATLDRLKKIEGIADGSETPRTRSLLNRMTNNGMKDLPIEYDDESVSQSQMSSVDDVTVEKASPLTSAPIDYLEDI